MLGMSAFGIWKQGELKQRMRHGKSLVMVHFSPVDHRLITCSMGSEIIIWNADTGERIHVLEIQAGGVTSCRFSEDGRLVLAGYGDGAVRLWDSTSGKLLTTLTGHGNRLRDARFNPDQSRILSWAMDDRAIVWDRTEPAANQLLVLSGNSKLLQAHWTPDGRDVVTAWSDGTIKVWRGATQNDLSDSAGKPPSLAGQRNPSPALQDR